MTETSVGDSALRRWLDIQSIRHEIMEIGSAVQAMNGNRPNVVN